MLWRVGKQLLVQRDESFYLVDPNGEPAGAFHAQLFSDEDDLWKTACVVSGDQLLERTTVQHAGDEPRVYEQKVTLTGLQPSDDDQSRKRADEALVKFDADAAAFQAERAQTAEARVTAIPGARSDLGLGPHAARAQLALCERVRRWDDDRSAALLRTLLSIAKIGPSAAVVTSYARGCLFACFDSDIPPPPKGSAPTPHKALAAELEGHARQLDGDAEGQEWADAMRNAAAYRKAAEAIRDAVKLLS